MPSTCLAIKFPLLVKERKNRHSLHSTTQVGTLDSIAQWRKWWLWLQGQRRKAEVVVRGGVVMGDLSLPGPWCPAHSAVSGWHCRSSAAGAAERRLWADRPPLCRRSLTEARWKERGKRGMKEGRKESRLWPTKGTYVCMCARVCDPSVIHGIEADLRRS